MKDRILANFVSMSTPQFEVDYENLSVEVEIPECFVILIVEQFEQFGLVKLDKYWGGASVCLHANIYDFFNHGGFTVQEEILRANLEKLNLELLKLAKDIEPSKLEAINVITSIAGNIATALGLFNK